MTLDQPSSLLQMAIHSHPDSNSTSDRELNRSSNFRARLRTFTLCPQMRLFSDPNSTKNHPSPARDPS